VSEICVRPEQRRHEPGCALVEAAFQWFERAEVGSIELHVLVDNRVARRFWEEMGFVPELLRMRAIRG
jgi:ribosomal protein S18 acetylase RimI-like enzyme